MRNNLFIGNCRKIFEPLKKVDICVGSSFFSCTKITQNIIVAIKISRLYTVEDTRVGGTVLYYNFNIERNNLTVAINKMTPILAYCDT